MNQAERNNVYGAGQYMTGHVFAQGTLPNATPVVQDMSGAPLPCVVALNSADGGRLIEVSVNGGVEYFVPTLDETTATMIVLAIAAPVSHIRLTGAAAGTDTWSIR